MREPPLPTTGSLDPSGMLCNLIYLFLRTQMLSSFPTVLCCCVCEGQQGAFPLLCSMILVHYIVLYVCEGRCGTFPLPVCVCEGQQGVLPLHCSVSLVLCTTMAISLMVILFLTTPPTFKCTVQDYVITSSLIYQHGGQDNSHHWCCQGRIMSLHLH